MQVRNIKRLIHTMCIIMILSMTYVASGQELYSSLPYDENVHELYFKYSFGSDSYSYNKSSFNYGYRYTQELENGMDPFNRKDINLVSVDFNHKGEHDFKALELPMLSYSHKLGYHSVLNVNDTITAEDHTWVYIGLGAFALVAIVATANEEEERCDPEFPILGPLCEFN